MKRILSILCAGLLLSGCGDSSLPESSKAEAETSTAHEDASGWRKAYVQTLHEFMESERYDKSASAFSFCDISGDGIPELIILVTIQQHPHGIWLTLLQENALTQQLSEYL